MLKLDGMLQREPEYMGEQWLIFTVADVSEINDIVAFKELKGKTVIVELVDRDVAAPPPPAGPINPIPSCP